MRTVPRYDVETMGQTLVTAVAPPPAVQYRPITEDSTAITGARVALSQPTTWWLDLRAVSEPFEVPGTGWRIMLADEAHWYAARGRGDDVPEAHVLVVPIREAWVEG